MLTFIRGPDPFVSKGEIYLKLPPEGAPVQPTHDDTMKMSPVFSHNGSQIAYTVPGHWDTWIVPTLGGTARCDVAERFRSNLDRSAALAFFSKAGRAGI
jgi:hypothetical protein